MLPSPSSDSAARPLPPALHPGRRGYPFDTRPAPAPPRRSDGSPWPRVTIITPSYNQGAFLEEALRSILLQGYPDLELLVYDGGSQDESVAILRRYAAHLSHWQSGPDGGQAQALNQGFARATGDIIAWLNSDDVYAPGALFAVAEALRPPACQVVFGDCRVIDREGRPQPGCSRRRRSIRQEDWVRFWVDFPAMQPAIFLSRQALQAVRGPDGRVLDEALRYAFDYDLWLRLSARFPFQPLPRLLAGFRRHRASKTLAESERFIPEILAQSRRYWGGALSPRRLRCALSAHVHLRSISRAYAAVEQADEAPQAAARTLWRAVGAFPLAPLLRPRPFLAAARRLLRGYLIAGAAAAPR